ncbi:hypothetical protein EHS39_08975 [Ensifer sp. MPMI2T]|nr:hypothetical protein EHS39_08975 [Ensifer sp. MPMI2T]
METKDVVAWAGILLSLGFNVINFRRTGQMWSRGHALTEFKSLKTPVDSALAKMRENKSAWKSLEAFGGTPKTFMTEAQKLNSAMTEQFVALTTALEALDASSHSKKSDRVTKLEASWETVVGLTERLYAPQQTLEQKKKILSATVTEIGKLIDGVAKDIEDETNGKIGQTSFWTWPRKS